MNKWFEYETNNRVHDSFNLIKQMNIEQLQQFVNSVFYVKDIPGKGFKIHYCKYENLDKLYSTHMLVKYVIINGDKLPLLRLVTIVNI